MGDADPIVRLAYGNQQVEIAPARGGAVATYRFRLSSGAWFDLLDTRPDPARTGPFSLGCNVLAPFSNRISGGGFRQDGAFHALAPNIEGEKYPNHGNAFSSHWIIEAQSATAVELSLSSHGPGPFRYSARLLYGLVGTGLSAQLRLTNEGPTTLPFGGGFHPWFPRQPDTSLTFTAEGIWTETPDHLPDRFLTLDETPAHDHRHGEPLPEGFTNVAYSGWNGVAEITWPQSNMALTMTAAAPLSALMLFTTGKQAPFFSLEPVSHTVDAHNRTGRGVVPPTLLRPGEKLQLTMQLEPREILPP